MTRPWILIGLLLFVGCGAEPPAAPEPPPEPVAGDPLHHPEEVHLRNVRQLTFGGENAEAYWSPDGRSLIFQSSREGVPCDQMFVMDVASGETRMVSNGEGKCTCGYFLDGASVVYSSTHLGSPACPPPPDYSRGYVWSLYPDFDVFRQDLDGGEPVRLTDTPGYDAEATVSPDGERIIFTSLRDGDLDLYTMRTDGSDVRRLTTELGYDGGAFYSRDGKRIVWRASRPQTDEERAAYRGLLRANAIKPMALDVYVADADGRNVVRLTDNGAANFGPYFFPDGSKVIFSSNAGDPGGRNFDLWMIGDDGSGLEQVTFEPTFDGFPMFSPDGTQLVFASNRNASERGETNLFLADWVD